MAIAKQYTTEDKQYYTKDVHIEEMYKIMDKIGTVILNASGRSDEKYGDPRVEMLTMLLTTFMLDDDLSGKIIAERDDNIKEIKQKYKSDAIERNGAIYRENIRVISKCFKEFDKFLGIKRKQIVMEVFDEDLKQEALNFGVFKCTADFAIDRTGTLEQAMKEAKEEVEEMGKRIDEKELKLKQLKMGL